MKRILNLLGWTLTLFLASVGIVESAEADTFYRETFNFCELVGGRPSAAKVSGWRALTSGHREGKASILKIQPVGAATGLPAINSDPEGPEDGNAFWARSSIGLLLYSDEVQFSSSELTAVAWRQRIDRGDKPFPQYGAKLALLIGSVWYISDTSSTQRNRGKFERVEVAPHSLTYGTTPFTPGFGPVAPKNSGFVLPRQATVQGFGLFLPRSYLKVRIDDFSLVNNAPAGTSSVDRVFERCVLPPALEPAKGQGGAACTLDVTATHLRLSSPSRAKLLRVLKGSSLEQLRDRIIVTFASMNLPLSAINAMTAKHLVKVRGQLHLRISRTKLVKVPNSLKSDVDAYLRKARIRFGSSTALIRKLARNKQSLSSSRMCLAELVGLIRSYAQKAKVSQRLSFS